MSLTSSKQSQSSEAEPGQALSQLSERELLERICSGDGEALLHLVVDRCGAVIQYLAQRYAYADDLSHDICVHLFGNSGDWKCLKTWKGDSSLVGWVGVVARNLCLSKIRRATKYREHLERLFEESGSNPELLRESSYFDGESGADEPGSLERLKEKITNSEVLRAIEQLSIEEQELVLFFYLHDPPIEIELLIRKFGKSAGGFRTAKSRIVAKLREALKQKGGE